MTEDINAYQERRKKEKLAENGEVQRRLRMTQEQRSREAIIKMGGQIKEHAEKTGFNLTGEAAHRKALEIAQKAEREKA